MIDNLKDLEKLLKLCRKQGVTDITLKDVSFKLGELPQGTKAIQESEIDPADPYADFPAGDLSPEQLAYYSSGGTPENDPFRTDN